MDAYRDLIAWQRGMELVTYCYQLTKEFPLDERFGLISQIRRAAVSVPANIAEGYGRGIGKAYVNHLWIANGSLKELETHLLIAENLRYLPPQLLQESLRLCEETGRLLTGLRRSIRHRSQKSLNRPPNQP